LFPDIQFSTSTIKGESERERERELLNHSQFEIGEAGRAFTKCLLILQIRSEILFKYYSPIFEAVKDHYVSRARRVTYRFTKSDLSETRVPLFPWRSSIVSESCSISLHLSLFNLLILLLSGMLIPSLCHPFFFTDERLEHCTLTMRIESRQCQCCLSSSCNVHAYKRVSRTRTLYVPLTQIRGSRCDSYPGSIAAGRFLRC
jgi:hypothetical protein